MHRFALRIACALACTVPIAVMAATSQKPCHLPGLKNAVLCGSIARPLNPLDPAGKHIDIHFAVVPSSSREKHADPVYFLAGGPGQSALEVMPQMLGALRRLNNRRDLVFVDQRGTGKSAALKCAPDAQLSLAALIDPNQMPQRMARCRAELERLPHGDLRQYTTSIAMADLDAVRAALGQERINLVGASYGTRAALEYLRLYPQRVRRMVLDGVAPADLSLPQSFPEDANAALQQLFSDCAADLDCAKRHPQLAERWEQLFTRLPMPVVISHPLTGATESLTLTSPMLASLARGPLYVPFLAAGLPSAIDDASQGRWSAMFGLASALGDRSDSGISMGMHFSVLCAEDGANSALPAKAGRFANTLETTYRAVCADWPRGAVDPGFYQIPRSTAPALLLSGGVDPATPPRHAERVAKAWGAQARHIVVTKAGHGILRLGCASDIVFQFLDNPDQAESLKGDANCLAHIPAARAFVPLAAHMKVQP